MKAKDLKNSILQMAVEGKLVPQDPSDEPASVLLERIRAEKHKLIAEGKAKFPKGGESIIYIGSDGSPYEKRVDAKGRVLSDECIADQVPFEKLPEGWAWARLSEVALVLNGDRGKNYPAKSKLHDSGIPFVSAINIEQGFVSESNMLYMTDAQYSALRAGKLNQGDIVFCIRGSLGKHGIFPFERGAIASSLVIVRLVSCRGVSPDYLNVLLDSATTKESIKKFDNGTAQPNLSANNFQSFLYPIPPLAEQRRIVERVNELVPLVDEYGSLEDAREELDAALPGRLRKSVLQMAVQGKLVPQDPDDEPASALLASICEQRRELIKQKKMKAPKGGESVIFRGSDGRRYEKRVDARGRESEPVCIEDEIPFEIPESWEWARLRSIAQISGGATPDKSNPVYWGGKIPWASMKDVHGDYLETTLDSITKAGFESKASISMCAPGDLIVSTRLIPGKSIICLIDTAINQDLKVLRLDEFEVAYLHFWFRSQLDNFRRMGSGTTVPGIKLNQLASSLIPVPPLTEQSRIVNRIAMSQNAID